MGGFLFVAAAAVSSDSSNFCRVAEDQCTSLQSQVLGWEEEEEEAEAEEIMVSGYMYRVLCAYRSRFWDNRQRSFAN